VGVTGPSNRGQLNWAVRARTLYSSSQIRNAWGRTLAYRPYTYRWGKKGPFGKRDRKGGNVTQRNELALNAYRALCASRGGCVVGVRVYNIYIYIYILDALHRPVFAEELCSGLWRGSGKASGNVGRAPAGTVG